jgi:hypothetical protein
VDCGGVCGATCNFQEACSVNGDCYTDNCAAGTCGKGATGASCGGNADCDSNLCVGGLCAGCADAVQNGGETDVDCGGPDCGPCFGGKICTGDADCLSGSCVGGFCALGATAAACSEGDQCLNGVCGGGTIPAANGVAITWNPDSSINDETAGTRASSTLGGTSKLGDSTITPAIPLGFTFRYFDQLYTTARITGNGWLSFTATSSSDSPAFLSPSTFAPNAVIAPFWFDADPSDGGANTDVRYLTTGTAPNRKFIVNWIRVPYYNDATDKATFQVILYENGGYVDMNCKDCTLSTTTTRAQIVENATGTQAFSAFSLNSSSSFNIPNQTAKRYYTNATNGASCLAPTCNDGVKNQGETDCGGAACGATCAPTKICAADTDCGGLGASCAGGFCRNCADGVLNGAETALDCGGRCGATCGGGLACNSGADCATSGCTGALCNLGVTGDTCTAGNQCADGVCSIPQPSIIATAPDAASLGNLTAGTQATSFGAKLGDSGHSDAVTLPFAFNFFGTDYSSVKINGNGWMSFDTASTNSGSPPTTSPSTLNPNAIIAGYWFDADATNSIGADVRYTTVGTAPNRKFIVNYIALPYYSTFSAPITDNVTFQIALNEGENTVDIFCADCTLNYAASRAQMLENAAGTEARSAFSLTSSTSFNIPDNTGRRYATTSAKLCQAPTATDGVKNGAETDTDCGGTSGTLCASAKACLANTDCGGTNATCNAGFCRNCGDAVKNGNETDLDCGGICGGNCGFNKICALSTDCASQNCASGLCGLSTDRIPCSVNGDCASSYCDGLKGATTATLSLVGALSDGTNGPTGDQIASAAIPLGFKFSYFGAEYSSVKLTTNGHISFAASPSTSNSSTQNNTISMWAADMNAGAGQIKYQTVGTAPFRKFIVNYNSLSHYSAGATVQAQAVLHESLNYVDILCVSCGVETSAPLSHYLAVRGASAADILEVGTLGTLGSTTALPANSGYRFVTDPLPTAGKICAPATCRDAATNGTEPSTDCGGSCGADCSKGAVCSAGTDCISGSCSGGFCTGLADAAACTLSGSCDSGLCVAGTCAVPACNDAVKNGAETATDCGGGTCGTCAAGLACSVSADCSSNRCDGGLCSTCTDNIKSGTETDVDCGGVCVSGVGGKCSLTKGCATNEDCGSGNCSSGFCAAPVYDCFNGVQDARETGVDCGGSDCAAKCLVGTICSVNSDCASGVCTSGICAKAATGGSCLSGSDCKDGVCSGGVPTAQTSSVSYTTPDDTWTTIFGLSTDSAKTASPIAIGFSMNYFGNQYTTFDATSNGWMALGTNGISSSTATQTLPSFTARNAIALFAQDSGSATSPVATYRYKVFGTAPFRKLIYDITGNRTYYNTASVTYTAQAVLYETTGRVEVVCNPCTQETTRAATQGVTNTAGTVSAVLSGRNNAAFSATDTAVFDTLAGRTCAAPANNDGVKNGTETDVDCGGSSGIACGYNLICAVGSDCKSAECNSGLCAKSTTGESCGANVDCLGANCAANVCGVGGGAASCLVNSDCASANCDTSGGSPGICGKLAVGASCLVNGDCQSDYCLAGTATDSQPGVYPATYAAIDATKPACTTASGTANCFTLGDTTKSANQTLPFAFKFFGVDYASFFISPDGYISFDTAESNTNGSANIALPTIPSAGAHPAVSPGPAIFLYWMDGNATGADSIRYWTEGTAPNRRVIVAYSAVPHFSGAAANGSFTGQIILNETSNTVEVQIEAGVQGTTLGARTRGVRNADGTQAFYYQGATHLDSENNRPFPSTVGSTLSGSRRLYRTNPAPSTCAAAGSRGAACVNNVGCLSGACVTSGVATALAAPGATPPADFQTSAAATASSTVSAASTTVLFAAATGVTLGIPLGFPYRFYGRTYTDVRGAATGYLSFLSTTTSSATFANLESGATSSQNGLIAYWWRSMSAFGATNNATFKTTGTSPFRVFTYDVNGLTSATAQPVKARVQLYESTSIIDVSCYNCSANGGTVSNSAQGIETADGTTTMGTPARVLTTATGGTNAARNNTAYRFNTGSAAVCF